MDCKTFFMRMAARCHLSHRAALDRRAAAR